MDDFTVSVNAEPGGTVVKVCGELRMRCEPLDVAMRRTLAGQPQRVIFDLSELGFISSLGMGLLIGCNRNLKSRGGRALLAGAQPLVLEALHRARLLEVMPNYETVELAANA